MTHTGSGECVRDLVQDRVGDHLYRGPLDERPAQSDLSPPVVARAHPPDGSIPLQGPVTKTVLVHQRAGE